MMSTGEDANVTHILFGAITTALGFVLIRKTLKSRSLLLGRGNVGGGSGRAEPSNPETTTPLVLLVVAFC